MQETKSLFETLTSEVKERDRLIVSNKTKVNMLVEAIKKLQSAPLPKDTPYSKDFQDGWNSHSLIMKQKLEELLFEVTQEFNQRLPLENWSIK